MFTVAVVDDKLPRLFTKEQARFLSLSLSLSGKKNPMFPDGTKRKTHKI